MTNINIEKHLLWFDKFTDIYLGNSKFDIKPLELKVLHSKRVLENAFEIIHDNNYNSNINLSIALAALYHDVGRFPQYIKYKTFKDSISVNHGVLGAKILKNNHMLYEEGFLIRAMVLCAVSLHNCFAVKDSLKPDVKLVIDAVRDSDKCDIVRVVAEELLAKGKKDPVIVLSVVDDESLSTAVILEDAMAGRVASYGQLQSLNDFKILLGTWMYDLHFSTSRKLLKESGYLESILANIKGEAHVLKVRNKLLKDLSAIS